MNSRIRILLLLTCTGVALSGCDNGEEADKLAESIEVAGAEIVSVSVGSQNDKVIFEPGEQWQFTATGTTRNGGTLDVSDRVNWSLSDTAVGSIDRDGTLTLTDFSGVRDIQVQAQWSLLEDQLAVTLSDASLISLSASITPNPVDECQSAALSATGSYDDGSVRPLEDVSFAVDDSTNATISGSRLLARNAASVNVTGSLRGITSPAAPVTISDTLAALTITNGSQLSLRRDSQVTLESTGDFSNGQSGTDTSASTTWSSSASNIASVDNAGRVTASAVGSATISAACGGLAASIVIDVLQVTGLEIVSPSSADLRTGQTRQLQLYEVLSDSSRATDNLADEDNVIWELEVGDEIATISDTGELTMADSFDGYSLNYIRVTADYDDFDDEIELFIDN